MKTISSRGAHCFSSLRQCISTAFLLAAMSVAVIALSGCSRKDEIRFNNLAGTTPDGTKHLVLESYEAKKGRFELVVAPCSPDGCAYEVRWHVAGKPVSTISMPVSAPNQEVTKTEIRSDPWGGGPGIFSWGAGEENSYVSTVAWPIRIDANTDGLLVTQQYGFDHIKRVHRLVVPKNDRLVFLWEYTEGAGWTWSAAMITPPSAITFFYSFRYFGEKHHGDRPDADDLRVTRFSFDVDKGVLIPVSPNTVVAAALVAGDFLLPDAAYNFQFKNDPEHCLQNYYAVSSTSIGGLPKGRTALAQVFTNRIEAEKEKRRLVQCGVKLKMFVTDVLASNVRYQDKE